jgi:hypothetical protein
VLTLESDGLRASILEPDADEALLGSRYVAGGYVWQVTDDRLGALLAGPAFPAENPPPFDGQGLPEVFETALGADRARVGDEVYVIGVGRVRRESPVRPFHVRDNPTVTEGAVWNVTATQTRFEAQTRGAFDDFAFELRRSVQLRGRVLESATLVRNLGRRSLPLRWFAHPFLPWPAADQAVARLSLETALPAGAPLLEAADGAWERRTGVDWRAGHYLLPRITLGAELAVVARHPSLGNVHIGCRFPLGGLAFWGNEHTCSFEPFFQTIVAGGGEATWAMEYGFGGG